MRVLRYYAAVMMTLLLAIVVCGAAWATQSIFTSAFNAGLDGWTVVGWENQPTPDPSKVGTGAWDPSAGNPGGGVHFAGWGITDQGLNHQREGAYMYKAIPTTGMENIRVDYDLVTHLVGQAWFETIGNDPADPKLIDHGDFNEQLTVFYTTNFQLIGGKPSWEVVWNEAEWLTREGGNGAEPLIDYNAGYGTRFIDLSEDTSANDNPQFALMFRWQFNTGCDATGGCAPDGGDWANLDNIRVKGHVIGSPTDPTPPGIATNFAATPRNGYCHLTWTNPTDTDFSGVVLVVNGDHVPQHRADGIVLVNNWTYNPGASGSFDDIGRDPGRQYFYRIWTRNGVPDFNEQEVSAAVTMTDYLWFEDFDSYANGNLNDVSSGQWPADPANAGQVIVTDAEAFSGTKSAKIENFSTAGGDGVVSHAGSFAGVDGLLQLHFQLKSPANNGNTFWHVDIKDNSGNYFGQIFGWESEGAFVAGSSGSPNFSISAGAWHSFDVIVDTMCNRTRFYMDGAYKFGATNNAGDVLGKVRLWNEKVGSSNDGRKVYVDNVYVTSPVHPRIVAPTNGDWLPTLTPVITWSRYGASPITSHQVRICSSDDPESAVYDSGTIAGSATSFSVPTALPQNTHLWAFVREQAAGGWGYWSTTGTGGFCVSTTAPQPPSVVAPTGSIATAKPLIVFAGDAHSLIEAKVTADPTGNNVAWDSGGIASTAYTLQSGYLAPHAYYAFVRIASPAGWSAWSLGQPFTVTGTNPVYIDMRHMNEAGVLTSAQAPNDGFADKMPGFEESGDFTVAANGPVCGNSWLAVHDFWSAGGRRGLRKHRLSSVDLDRGVTFVTAVAITHEEGSDGPGRDWRQANIMIADFDGNVCHTVGFKIHTNMVGLITTDAAGNSEDNGTSWTTQSLPSSSEYRIVRITGRNAVPGNPSSAVWKVYINENPVPVLTATGTMDASVIENDSPPPPAVITYPGAWTEDFVCIGSGSRYLGQDLSYDWTAVNMSGDFAPGEWDPLGTGNSYLTLGAAKLATMEAHAVTITGPTVITKVLTHTDLGPDLTPGTEDDITYLDGYFVQDVTGGLTTSGVKISTSDAQGGAVIAGAKVTSITGVMANQSDARAIANPNVTIEGTAPFAPLGMSQKQLMGPCIDQGLGSVMDTTGMLVRTFGRVPAAPIWDPALGLGGSYILYVDDGSGVVDGRESSAGALIPGIRFVLDGLDPNLVTPGMGDYLMVEGIAGYEAITAGSYPNVRRILNPTFTILAPGT